MNYDNRFNNTMYHCNNIACVCVHATIFSSTYNVKILGVFQKKSDGTEVKRLLSKRLYMDNK